MPIYHTEGAHIAVTDLSSAVTITNDEDKTRGLIVQALAKNVRYTLSNTTPTASVGFQLVAGGTERRIDLEYGMSVRFIEEEASANLQYQWVI